MLYEYIQLRSLSFENTQTPLIRYLYKFLHRRKEIRRLKTHEKDFLFKNMSILRDETNVKCFDLASINEASEFYFNYLILTYYENLNFDKLTRNHLGQVIDEQSMENDKVFFDNYLDQWREQLATKKGKYFGVLHTELSRRLKELRQKYNDRIVNEVDFNYQVKNIYSIAFFIYYKVKLFFDSTTDKFVVLNVSGVNVVINVYSFIHILFRHYFPSMDIGCSDRSINDQIPFLDIAILPYSVRDFLITYFNFDKTQLTPTREYLLFSFNRDKYIAWLKYCELEELGCNYGFEFRTLYKCFETRDLDKFNGLTEHSVSSVLSFYY